MRNIRLSLARAAAVPAVFALSVGTAIAQSAPAVPTSATALAQTVDLADAKNAGLVIVGLMVTAGVVLWGARLVMSKFKPKI